MKGKYLVIIIVVLFIIFNGTKILLANQTKNALKQDTEVHLHEKGYSEADIKHIELVNMKTHSVKYAIVITFEDEPEADYFYTYEKEQGDPIIQFDALDRKAEGTLKHLE